MASSRILRDDRGRCRAAFAGVSFKPWCAARQTMPATQALRELSARGHCALTKSPRSPPYVLPPHLKMIDHGVRPGDRASFLTSLPYQFALAALQPAQTADLTLAAAVPLSALQEFMARVKVAADETLLAAYPTSMAGAHPCRNRFGPPRAARRQRSGRPGTALHASRCREQIQTFRRADRRRRYGSYPAIEPDGARRSRNFARADARSRRRHGACLRLTRPLCSQLNCKAR